MHFRYTVPGSNPFTRQLAQSPNGMLWDEAVVVDGAALAAGTTTPATPNPTVTPGTPARPAGNAADDEQRRGMLADLQKERTARQAAERRAAQHETDLATERRRIQALVGANPKSTEDTEIDAIRARFAQVFPGLSKLSDVQIEKLLATAERGDSLEEATQHHWQTHGRQMLSSVVTDLSDAIGGDLTERQQKQVKQAFARQAEEDPAFLARYESGDPTLVKEFVKQFVEDWFKPALRQVTAGALGQQRRVPNGNGRSVTPGATAKKIDFNKPKDVEDAMVEAFARHGGSFGE